MLAETAGCLDVLAQAVPPITGSYVLYLVMRVLHILSAMILVGGLFYMKTVLVPTGVDPYAGQRQVWARWVGMATFFLIVSGLVNFMNLVSSAKTAGTPLPPMYHMLFGIKFLLGLFLIFLASILSGKTPLAERFRLKMGRWLSIAWSTSLAIVILAAILRTFHR